MGKVRKPRIAKEQTPVILEEIPDDLELATKDTVVPEQVEEQEIRQINHVESSVTVNAEKEEIMQRIKDNAANHQKEYFDNRAKQGCDYGYFGEWQKCYDAFMSEYLDFAGKKVLDIGGAFGALAYAFLRHNPEKVTCTDISKYAIDKRQFIGIDYKCVPMQIMKGIKDEEYDIVHVSHVFECVPIIDHERCVKEICRVMKPGATCIILGDADVTAIKDYFAKHIKCSFSQLDRNRDSYGYYRKYNWKNFIVKKL